MAPLFTIRGRPAGVPNQPAAESSAEYSAPSTSASTSESTAPAHFPAEPGVLFRNFNWLVIFLAVFCGLALLSVAFFALVRGRPDRARHYARRGTMAGCIILSLVPIILWRAAWYTEFYYFACLFFSWGEFWGMIRESCRPGEGEAGTAGTAGTAGKAGKAGKSIAAAALAPAALAGQIIFFILPLAAGLLRLHAVLAGGGKEGDEAPESAAAGGGLEPGLPLAAAQDIFFVVQNSDLFQYFGGAVLGLGRVTPKPFPDTSPKKSAGGYVFALVISVAFNGYLFGHTPAASTLLSLLGFLGDLTASHFKREAGAKDFSKRLGSHGGLLDRFDGCLFACGCCFVLFSAGVVAF